MTFDSGVPEYTVEEAPDGFAICQRGMAMETPAGAPIVVPTAFLAESLLEEVLSRTGKRDPGRTPFMQLAIAAIDVVRPTRDEVIDQLMAFADSELLCHRADEPKHLAKQQQKIWQPVLDWCAARLKAPLKVGVGVMPIEQPTDSIEALRRTLTTSNDFVLVGLMQAVPASGSLILGLALAFQFLTSIQVFEAAELDATFQMEKWGDDPETTVRHDAIRLQLILCGRWFSALKHSQIKKTGAYETAGGY